MKDDMMTNIFKGPFVSETSFHFFLKESGFIYNHIIAWHKSSYFSHLLPTPDLSFRRLRPTRLSSAWPFPKTEPKISRTSGNLLLRDQPIRKLNVRGSSPEFFWAETGREASALRWRRTTTTKKEDMVLTSSMFFNYLKTSIWTILKLSNRSVWVKASERVPGSVTTIFLTERLLKWFLWSDWFLIDLLLYIMQTITLIVVCKSPARRSHRTMAIRTDSIANIGRADLLCEGFEGMSAWCT